MEVWDDKDGLKMWFEDGFEIEIDQDSVVF